MSTLFLIVDGVMHRTSPVATGIDGRRRRGDGAGLAAGGRECDDDDDDVAHATRMSKRRAQGKMATTAVLAAVVGNEVGGK